MRKYSIVFLLLFLVSVAVHVDAQDKKGKDVIDSSKVKFPAVKDFKLDFEIVSPERDFYAEEPVVLIFRLENVDTKKITIYEWMMKEGDNIIVYYKPYDGNYTKFVESEWKSLKPNTGENPRRSSLQLNRNNSVVVTKELDLSNEVMQAELAKGGKKFYVMGALNLKSLSLMTQPVVIRIK